MKCVRVCVCVCVCAFARACVRSCVRACARALRIVSTDKILRFINTFIIIVVTIIIYPFNVLKMQKKLRTFASSIMPVKLSVKN